jgi:cystathionine beta-lyase/cystathionine gamma-synthase
MKDQKHMSTQLIHAGQGHDHFGAAVSPLYDTTTFSFENTAALLAAVESDEPAVFYTRYGMNPTIQALEQRLTALDQAEKALAFSSGMAAISSVCLAFGQDGIVCLGEVYGGTASLLKQQLPQLGISTRFVRSNNLALLQEELKKGVSLVVMETPANPTLSVSDIRQVAEFCRQTGARLMVDNTFATPLNQQPLAFGADFAVQSATKYLGGHSDLTAGVVAGSSAELRTLNEWRKNLGQTIAAEVAHKLMRSLVTLPLRIEKHNQNAMQLARFLSELDEVDAVHYPGLASHPAHQLACKQMQGFGGMLSFTVKGGTEAASRFADNLHLITLAASLGGAETLATQPVTSSHHGLTEDELQQAGISGAMIRLSVGLEDVNDLIADIKQALLKSAN